MKKVALLIFGLNGILLQPMCLVQEAGASTRTEQGQIVATKNHNVFEGLLLSVWSKLRSINPTQKQSANVALNYAAGIRGAESTETLLKPYWKNDLSQDEAFQTELALFSKAQIKLDKGDLENAVKGFDQFIDIYQQSSLRPNALIARSLGLAGMGKNKLSVVSMQLFIDENPNHPLINDAMEVLNELSG